MKYTIKESELKNLVRKHIVESLRQRKERSNEDRLKQFIKESVKKAVNEIKLDNPHNNLSNVDNAFANTSDGTNKFVGGSEDFVFGLAELMVDNNLTVNDLQKYGNMMKYVSPELLNKQIERYKMFLKAEEEDDKRREAQAWAEQQMSDMGGEFAEEVD